MRVWKRLMWHTHCVCEVTSHTHALTEACEGPLWTLPLSISFSASQPMPGHSPPSSLCLLSMRMQVLSWLCVLPLRNCLVAKRGLSILCFHPAWFVKDTFAAGGTSLLVFLYLKNLPGRLWFGLTPSILLLSSEEALPSLELPDDRDGYFRMVLPLLSSISLAASYRLDSLI